MALLFIANRERQAVMMRLAAENFKHLNSVMADLKTIYVEDANEILDDAKKALQEADFVLISWMGYSEDVPFLKYSKLICDNRKINYTILSTELNPAEVSKGVSLKQYQLMHEYLSYSGNNNCQSLWHYIVNNFSNESIPNLLEPKLLHWNGIYHPQSTAAFTSIQEYYKQYCQPDKPTIAVLFSRDEWIWHDLAYQKILIKEIKAQKMNVLPIFSQWSKNTAEGIPGLSKAVKNYCYIDGKVIVDAVINTFKFSLTNGIKAEQQFLYELNCPILQAYGLLTTEAEWRDSAIGMSPIDITFSLAMPELDGVIHSVPLSVKEADKNGIKQYLPIADRLAILVRKAKKWAMLKKKANKDKKIAIIFHNYPPTNASIGSAQGLDSPESVRLLLEAMQSAGYTINNIPCDSKSLMSMLLKCATNDRRFLSDEQARRHPYKISRQTYQSFFDKLPLVNRQQLTNDWQQAPGDVFVYEDDLLVPGMQNGNIFITVQPPRGFGEDPSKIIHDPACAPTHHYLAYYHWLRDIWQADAVIHVGTHGSLEWLPGKGAGLSENCYPELALDDLPNIYPYLLTIVGEGIQAKRRGAACLIGHLPPPVAQAGMYEGLAELEKLLDEYVHFATYELNDTIKVEELIRQKASELHLDEVLDCSDDDFAIYRQKLHNYLTEIKHMQIRVGLHVLGKVPEGDNLNNYLLALVQAANGDIPSLPQMISDKMGYDYYELFKNSTHTTKGNDNISYGRIIDDITANCTEIVKTLALNNFAADCIDKLAKLPCLQKLYPILMPELKLIIDYICNKLVSNLNKTEQEIINTIRALSSCYIEPGPAGAPTSGCADILPTGRNFYGIDPDTLPSKAAWEAGKTLGDEVIARFIQEEGRYPESIGMVFWSGSNMRSHGQCVAEFFYLLGVKPVWQGGSMRVRGLTVIPLAELKRPRIDAIARISGLFRDTLPQATLWMDKAVRLVADLDETDNQNYIRKHVLTEQRDLLEAGADKAALEQAYYRIFGCPPSTYGAGIGALLEAKNWETVDDLAAVYVRWGAHAYGESQSGTYVPNVFRRCLQGIEVTVKNEDNHEVHMLNSDDFNAYHGGMIAAVRSISGKAPRSYCGDSSDRSHVVLRSLNEEMKRLYYGEVMNPKYIKGMQKHGYKGAADLAGTVAHCYDWDATSQIMENWMYDGLADKYALDKQMQEWMKDVNPWALQRIAEKLLEAEQRGMWQAAPAVLEQLRSICLSIEGDLEERSDYFLGKRRF